jgi:hypothetical protein
MRFAKGRKQRKNKEMNTNMQCQQFEQILEQQDDGPLPQPALAHIDACQACRTLLADFGAIDEVAQELGAEEIAPPERVWIALRNQLEAERLIHDSRPQVHGASIGWWAPFQRPALAGAFLSLILAAAVLISTPWGAPQAALHPQLAFQRAESSPIFSSKSVFKQEMQTVGNDVIPGLQRENAAVTDSIRRNLGVVDNFIAMCEKSVREEPDNEMAREYLYGAYQQKAELLATAMNRSMAGGLQ